MLRSTHAAALLLSFCVCHQAHGQMSTPVTKEAAADQRAYHAALAIRDPAQRLLALRTFTVQYPDSKYFDAVQDEALRVLLKSFPSRAAEIEDQVRVNIQNADKGLDKWQMEANEAEQLASANVALPLARKLAEDAYRSLTEDNYGRTMARTYGQLELPLPAAPVILSQFKSARAAAVVALAHVSLQQGRLSQAVMLLNQAATLEPINADLHALRGELALRTHHNAEALDELEQAQVLGELTAKQQETMQALYRAAHDGSDGGLQDDLDARYKVLFPPPFTPAARAPLTTGHTVLLEEFTGSACEPCAGADTAVEALLGSYTRSELIALEWHEHVPRPDPLANPASVARAEMLDAEATPQFVLDGKRIPVFGGPREASEAVYKQLTGFADAQISRFSGIMLELNTTRDADGTIHAIANVQTQPEDALRSITQRETAPWPGEKVPLSTHTRAQPAKPSLAVQFALVEDNIRYSGENGIRLHRMAVRAVSPGANPLQTSTAQTLQASFDPQSISNALTRYLSSYEKNNDRYGEIRFPSKGMALLQHHLAVVAWIEDTVTHRVLQAAFAPVSDHEPAAP